MKKEYTVPFVKDILKLLEPHGPITARAMFGGFGIYFDKIIFASIVEEKLYFRVDDANRKDYAPFDSQPFVYDGGRKPVTMPYLTLPDEILRDPKKLPLWIQKSVQASLRYKLKIKKGKSGTNSY